MTDGSLLDRLIRRLDVQAWGDDRYRGGSGVGGVTAADRLFGGLVVAQATVAALRHVAAFSSEFALHSLHSYFLRPGRAEQDIELRVQTTKAGRRYQARSVEAWQRDQLILTLQASFALAEDGVHHQVPMPDVPAPHALPNRDVLRGRPVAPAMPLDLRMATPITEREPLPPEQQVWFRANGPVPGDADLQLGLLVYATDRTLLETAWRPHADRGELHGASLDHSLWLHRPPDFADWQLYTMTSPVAAVGRGLVHGAVYGSDGGRICSVAQEGVLRWR